MANLRLIFLLTITWCQINLAYEYVSGETIIIMEPRITVDFFKETVAPLLTNGKKITEISNTNEINEINEYTQRVKPLSEKILGQYFKKKPYYIWERDSHFFLVVSAILIACKYYCDDGIWNVDVISKKRDNFPDHIIPALIPVLFYTEADILKTIDYRLYKLEQELIKP